MDIKNIKEIITAIEQFDADLIQHMERTAMYSLALARRLNLSSEEKELAYFAGFLHDIGKVNIDLSILRKEGALSKEELDVVREQIYYGSNFLKFNTDFSKLVEYLASHQERFDGTGFPGKLEGENIPLISRITQLADSYDSMRYLLDNMKHQDALLELRRCAGTQFDPELVEHFIRAVVKEKLLNFDIEQ